MTCYFKMASLTSCRRIIIVKKYNEIRSVTVMQKKLNQRTNGPVNAYLISWPSKAENIPGKYMVKNDLDLQYSHTFINSISCLHLPTFRSHAAIVSEKFLVFTFSHRNALVTKFDLAVKWVKVTRGLSFEQTMMG